MKIWILLAVMFLPVAAGAQSNLPSTKHIYVEGSARVSVEPEILKLSGKIEGKNVDMKLAVEALEELSARLIKVCLSSGIDRTSIRASMPQVSPSYEYVNGKREFVGYVATRDIQITIGLKDNYYPIVNAIIETKTITTLNSKFSVQNPEAVLNEAQLMALDDAHKRANRLAQRAGTDLAGIHSISEFNLREWEPDSLVAARYLVESSLGADLDQITITGSKYIGKTALFEPDGLEAQATIYVVYLLKGD